MQRWLKFAKYLPDYGIRPVVLTVDPKYAEYPVIDCSLEADISSDLEVHRTKCKSVYELYKKLTGSVTSPYCGFANEGKPGLLQKIARFIRGNFFLPDARRGWVEYAFPEACRIIEKYGIETVITTGPPHSTHLAGLKIKEKYNVRWIADFRDPWSNIQYKSLMYQTRFANRIDAKYERRVMERCDVLLLAVDERERFYKIHPHINREKMLFMPNGYDESDFEGVKFVCPDKFLITYTGTIAINYPTDGLIKALLKIREQLPLTVRFIGKVDEHTREQFQRYLGENTEFTNFVDHIESINYLMSSSVLLLINVNVEGVRFLLHGKIFEYLASGKPILLLGPTDGKAAQLIKNANAGEAFDYNDVEGIADFLLRQYKNQIEKIRTNPDGEFIGQYSRKRLTQRLAEIICR